MFNRNGDRQGLSQIKQFQNGHEVRVGVYDPTAVTENKITWNEKHKIFWQGSLRVMVCLGLEMNEYAFDSDLILKRKVKMVVNTWLGAVAANTNCQCL